MNFKPTIIALALVVLSISVFGQYKYIQKLGSLATVALPDTPKLVDEGISKLYATNYHGVLFLAQAGDIRSGLKDLFSKNKVDSIYDGYIGGLMGGTKGKIFYKNKININGQDGLEFGYKAELNGQVTFRYHRIAFLNDTLVMSGIWASDSLSKDHKNLVTFFNGFKVKSKEQITSDSAAELGHKTGKFIATLIAIAIPILLGLGIVFIIRRIIYRKKNKTRTY